MRAGSQPAEWSGYRVTDNSGQYVGWKLAPVEFVALSSLHPNCDKERAKSQEYLLAGLSKPNPVFQAIVVSPDGEILDGNHRYRWAREHGFHTIPVQRKIGRNFPTP
jgi:hypothetical protein